mgnify:CR=1 FL=1
MHVKFLHKKYLEYGKAAKENSVKFGWNKIIEEGLLKDKPSSITILRHFFPRKKSAKE